MDKLNENLWKIHDKNQDLIKYADTKTTVLLTGLGVIIGVIYANADAVLIAIETNSFTKLIAVISFLACVFSIYFCIKSLSPNLEINTGDEVPLFFKDILKRYYNNTDEASSLSKDIKNALSNQRFSAALDKEIMILSSIAQNKYKYLTRGIYCIGGTLFCIFLEIGIYFFTIT